MYNPTPLSSKIKRVSGIQRNRDQQTSVRPSSSTSEEERLTFGPHGEEDVGAEPLARPDLVGYLEGNLNGHQMSTFPRPIVV